MPTLLPQTYTDTISHLFYGMMVIEELMELPEVSCRYTTQSEIVDLSHILFKLEIG